jgi:hypothetical protein
MDIEFDYNAPDVPDSAVADVVASIVNHGKPPPLSDEDREIRRLEKEAYRWECRRRDEERRIERERREAERAEAASAELAAEIAESNRKARLQRQEQIDRETQRRELADLRLQSVRQQSWQNSVEQSAWNNLAAQYRHTLIAELDAMISPPPHPVPPEPEPEVAENDLGSPNIGDDNFNPRYWLQKPIFE